MMKGVGRPRGKTRKWEDAGGDWDAWGDGDRSGRAGGIVRQLGR